MKGKVNSLRFFRLGVDFIPKWFETKMKSCKVEWVFDGHKMKMCILHDDKGNKQTFKAGSLVTSDMLFNEEPERNLKYF